MKKRILPLLLSLSLLPAALAAEESSAAKNVSLELYPKWYSSDNVTFQGNIGVKKLFHQDDWVTYYVKPSTTYALDHHFALHSGLGLYFTNNQAVNNVREWRPFLGLSHATAFTDKWGLSSYFRAEERYFESIGGDERSRSTRLRLRLRSAYKTDPHYSLLSLHKLTLDLEGFRSYTDTETITPAYDYETRITLGAERNLDKVRKIRFELAWKYKTQARQISNADIHTVFFKIQFFPSWGSRLRNRLYGRDIDE